MSFLREKLICQVLLILVVASPRAAGALDLSGNGVSEIWTLLNPEVAADDRDNDGDGQSNFEEMVAGTNPVDADSQLRLKLSEINGETLEFRWEGILGKTYTVEELNLASSSWEVLEATATLSQGGGHSIQKSVSETTGIYRLVVRDTDADADGLTAWEEGLLGWSDSSANSSEDSSRSDYEQAISLIENPDGGQLNDGTVLPRRLPSAQEASRFLVQTTFGPTLESIAQVQAIGMTAWVDAQMALPVSTTRESMFATGVPWGAGLWKHGWFRSAGLAEDQLRHRMAYALSQILVINGDGGTVIGNNPLTQAAYYDPILEKSFSSYRDVLEHVTYSPAMGFYLSHLNNRKGDPLINRFPDENFAREIMQLFTIGLWKLNPDGSRILDLAGNSIPTYDNSVIVEMAKIFTGMSNSTTNRGNPATSFFDFATGDDYKAPMKVWDEEHEPGLKTLFDETEIPDGQTGEEDVQQTLDALCAHRNMPPFIGRLLIQRFTSSNPSPEYLARVSASWSVSNGDLGKVMRAIVFDPEARGLDLGEGRRGKVREPLLRLIHIMKAFAKPVPPVRYGVNHPQLEGDLGQFAMSSPSVFNFYSPDFIPSGLLRENLLASPELEIATSSILLSTHDRLRSTVYSGHVGQGADYTEEQALLGQSEVFLDHIDLLLTYGAMSDTTRSILSERLNEPVGPTTKVRRVVTLLVNSPDFAILK